MTLESLAPNSSQAGLMESANCRADLNESALRLVDCNGSNWGPFKALSMVGKSQGGTVRGGNFPGAS